MSDRFSNTPRHTPRKLDPWNFNPKSPFICVAMAVSAAAEQNPEITGADIRSTIKPVK